MTCRSCPSPARCRAPVTRVYVRGTVYWLTGHDLDKAKAFAAAARRDLLDVPDIEATTYHHMPNGYSSRDADELLRAAELGGLGPW